MASKEKRVRHDELVFTARDDRVLEECTKQELDDIRGLRLLLHNPHLRRLVKKIINYELKRA